MKRAEIIEALYKYLVSEDNADLFFCAEERAPVYLGYISGAIDFARHMVEKAEAGIEELPVVEADKWISTAERQPEESGAYLCRTAKRAYLVVNYSKRHNTWNAFDSEDEPKYAMEVTYWMYIPEPPEENDK